MARPLRFLPPECPLVEVTTRTLQGRFLLRPSAKLNRIVRGVLARAARLHQMKVCAFVFLSNHYHLLLRPRSATQLASFMNYLNGNLAKEAGRLHRWRERFWGRRYRAVPVSFEPEAQIARLRYLLEQGSKEGLVAKPQDWPGASSLKALRTGEPVVGTWFDRTAEYQARRRGESVTSLEFASEETLELAPLPCWAGRDPSGIRAAIEALLAEIVAEAAEHFRKTGTRPMGRRAILRQNPHDRPRRSSRSPAPRFHAATFEIRKMLEAMYRAFVELRTEVIERLGRARAELRFPAEGIPPPQLAAASRA